MTKHLQCNITLILFLFILFSNPQALSAEQDKANEQSIEKSQKNGSKETKPIEALEKTTETNQPSSPDINQDNDKNSRLHLKISAPIDTVENQKNDLEHYLSAQKIQPILVGTKEFTTLVKTNNAAIDKGIAILLPDWQQNVTTPKGLHSLQALLPDQGWTTISVLPPKKPNNYPSYKVKKADKEEENKQILMQYQQTLANVLTEVTEKAKNYPGIIVVIAEGHIAALLLNIYQQAQAEPPTAFVMMSAHLDDAKANLMSAKSLSQLDLPVLDLYLKNDNLLIQQNIALRKKWVNQALKSNFRQRRIYNIHPSYYPASSLTRAINGWLKSIGW